MPQLTLRQIRQYYLYKYIKIITSEFLDKYLTVFRLELSGD